MSAQSIIDILMLLAQGDEEEDETDNLVNQVLDEIGINLDEQMVAAPGQKAQVCRHKAIIVQCSLSCDGFASLAQCGNILHSM